jgi:hypothetical protein
MRKLHLVLALSSASLLWAPYLGAIPIGVVYKENDLQALDKVISVLQAKNYSDVKSIYVPRLQAYRIFYSMTEPSSQSLRQLGEPLIHAGSAQSTLRFSVHENGGILIDMEYFSGGVGLGDSTAKALKNWLVPLRLPRMWSLSQ